MLFLIQDGITNGAIYALLGLALVLVFAVTRVILIPQGEFVTFGALTYATLSAGQYAGHRATRGGDGRGGVLPRPVRRPQVAASAPGGARLRGQYPAAGCDPRTDDAGSPAKNTPIAVNIALSLLIVAAIGLFLYRIAFQPLAHTSVLVLLIASVGCHLALQGLGLVFFGAEGQRGPAIWMPPSPSARCTSPARASRSTASPSPSSSRSGCSSASRSTARRCAPPPSTGSARGWSASAPRCRDRSHSCWPR